MSSSSISRRFPLQRGSHGRCSWQGRLLQGHLAALGQPGGGRGCVSLESSRSLVSLRKSHPYGGHIQSAAALHLGRSVACLLAYVPWPRGSTLRAWVPRVPGLRATSLVPTAAYEGTLPLCRFLSCAICFVVVLFGF